MTKLPEKNFQRIAIVGAAGRLGAALSRCYSKTHDVVELTRSELKLDDARSIQEALIPLEFDLLLLSGALTAVDYCETHEDEAFAINGIAPGLIAEVCAEKGAHMTYISTDFVFDGMENGSYDEERAASPVSVYGASKLEGEKSVFSVSSDNLVARVSWLYGSGKPAFPEWIIGQAAEKEALSLPGEKTGSPTYTEDVVDFLALLLGFENDATPASGIYHLSNSGSCTWQEWGQFCLDEAVAAGRRLATDRIDSSRLSDIAAFAAKRPVNSVLGTEKFTRFTGIIPRPWQAAMRDHFSRTLFLK